LLSLLTWGIALVASVRMWWKRLAKAMQTIELPVLSSAGVWRQIALVAAEILQMTYVWKNPDK